VLGAVLAPLVFLVLWNAPLALEEPARRLAAVFGAVLVLWVSEAIPIAATALLIAPALVLCGITNEKEAFGPYASPLLFLFVGGFMLARTMTRHGLDTRIAYRLISLPGIAGRPRRVRLVFLGTALLFSMWVSNTATTAMLLPILIRLEGADCDESERRATSGSILAIAYAASVGGLGTPVGSPPNLIAIEFLREHGVSFGFLEWVQVGLPTALLLVLAIHLLFHWRSPPREAVLDPGPLARLGTASRAEWITAFAFGLAVTGWMLPGMLRLVGSPLGERLEAALPASTVALVALVPLFALPARTGEPERVLPWTEATRIDWGIILLFGGGISLGRQMIETGLAGSVARGFVAATGVEGLWPLTAMVIVFTIFFTEACSNTATANMLAPLVIAIAGELGVSPIPPVLGVGLAASCAFMLPIATGPNAIAYGTGRVVQSEMIRMGLVLNLVAAVGIFLLLRLACPVLGWT